MISSRGANNVTGQRDAYECPLWVMSRHRVTSLSFPLFLSKRTFIYAVCASALCHKRTPRQINQGLTAWSSTADSFEDEAVDDAANRALLCEVGTDQAVRGLAP